MDISQIIQHGTVLKNALMAHSQNLQIKPVSSTAQPIFMPTLKLTNVLNIVHIGVIMLIIQHGNA